ncbi:(Fe-S)-binding protein [Sandaracinomonas limnophila]|uniref:(Fe-S)-binding protein n=1 Tax=Sandaracinomonas limnophila TaxID=1862386 RepID=A0A437PTX8_9BACT|nr:(Fe-S)-binding protein [Sandaracinomonas limnophila]RVU25714.1 (Fe-S)-binding protein [Sandaracinomonas limnophila]
MITWVSSIIFIALLLSMGQRIVKRFKLIAQTIHLTQPLYIQDHPKERLNRMMRLAFGQQKMFDKPLVALFHLFIYLGFILINIKVLEIIIDGIFGTHRIFASILGSFYPFLINFFEILSGLVFVACIFFFIRRALLPIKRFQHPDLNGFPRKDAFTILGIEMILMLALWTMNACDALLQQAGNEHYPLVGQFIISQNFIPLFTHFSIETIHLIERIAWWFHITGILSFALYVTYSKHLHIFFAFPATYFSNLSKYGTMQSMPSVEFEVKNMLGLPTDPNFTPNPNQKFGAKDVFDLHIKNALDAYSCTECGRCTEQCPANNSGRKLSPRKIMMATRDRLEDVGKVLEQNKGNWVDDGKALLNDYISGEELRACTTCQACLQACPIELNPLDIILQMRRFQIMELSDAPNEWNLMFNNLETNQAPWKFNPNDRLNWATEQ